MSSLYETPAERAKRLSGSTKTGNFFQDSWTDMVSSGISLGEDGELKRDGAAWWFQALTPGAKSIAEQKKGLENSKIIEREVQSSGLTKEQIREQLGDGKLTVGNVSGTIAEGRRTRAEKPTPTQQAQIDDVKAGRTQQTAAMNANTAIQRATLDVTRENNKNQMTLAANQMEMARLDNKFDRETASADRALTLQLGQMNADLQDKRLAYDRETRSMDKRDRMIAQLMSGLGSLGGAFSL
tara:strand:- start:1333 stop:2052 length:720 start_codon:yes stop_codon:yes gene_type:complete